MKEFVYGTDEQYNMLKESLNDGLCHVYNNCEYPQCCSVPAGRIGFEKEANSYALFIDKGVSCSKLRPPSGFKEWLSSGTLRFIDFNDLKEFLKSLDCLY